MNAVRKLKRIADYLVVELLGAGGMGAVFLGQRDGEESYAAIKVMLDKAATTRERARFKREIALTKRVTHPNLIGIIDSGETPDGLSYLVIPALVGKELRSLLKAQKGEGLPPAQACAWFEHVLEGVQALHDAGIVHRDLKPENVMVLGGAERVAKVMDLGLARLANEPDDDDPDDPDANFRTIEREVVGSPQYIAPESVMSEPVDGRTDVYSLGIILFEMLTGKLPFDSDTPQGYLSQHLALPPATLSETRPERTWPKEAEDLLERMLAKTKDERIASCREVLAILRGGLSAKLAATSAPVAEPPARDARVYAAEGILGRLKGQDA
jgi:serine/threonine-protein kinase